MITSFFVLCNNAFMIKADEMKKYLQGIENLSLNDKQIEKLCAYSNFVLEENIKYNLTSITDEQEFIIKHIYDSLALCNFDILADSKNIIDAGTGAGLPGIPLAITHKMKKFSLIESNTKKSEFVKAASEMFDIPNVVVLNNRSEVIAHDKVYRERYDCVVTRAFANFSAAMELTSGLLKTNGIIVYFASKNQSEKITNTEKVIKKLKLHIRSRHTYSLPESLGERELIVVEKRWKTIKQYPRTYSKIKNNPI